MKTTLKLSTFLVALATAFTFSSCLNGDDSNNYATYSSYVTIDGDQFIGYRFHSDFGATLMPTSASVQEVLPGLNNSNVKRAYVAFETLLPKLKTARLWKLEKRMTSSSASRIMPTMPSRLTQLSN